jgi:hypothetical protein
VVPFNRHPLVRRCCLHRDSGHKDNQDLDVGGDGMAELIKIESALSNYFDPRRSIIVPNVWWGLGLNHECDLFVLTKSGFAYEVEIKISKVDLARDILKRHGHKSNQIRKLYFAIPGKMERWIDLIPDHAGILILRDNHIHKLREAKNNQDAKPLPIQTQLKLAHLGCMRMWKLKRDFARIYPTQRQQYLEIEQLKGMMGI